MVDLHRHDMFSRFDGYGTPRELAELAAELGHTSLATSNHGNTNSLVQTYKACQEVGIKPILGVEGYFLPVHREKTKGSHLCLYTKNLQGYKNLNSLQYKGEKIKYYNPLWTFAGLKKFHEGLICTSACVAGYMAQAVAADRIDQAEKFARKMVSIFGDDFYLEIQPYSVSEPGLQEKVNLALIDIGKRLKIKCIVTSDSHYGRKEEFDTYLKMHEMDGRDLSWVEGTYKERYMPTEDELRKRFIKMHGKDLGKKRTLAVWNAMITNLKELEDKVDGTILDQLDLQLPKLGGSSDEENWKEIQRQVRDGLKRRGLYTKEYIDRCKAELDVIKTNGFVDYFLIVSDYTNYAKENGIAVGPGRGSVCNSLVAFAMHITEVDSLKFDLDFRRFMRYDKKALPDIDLDFEMDRRDEVIDYLTNKYKRQSARVSTYGLYQINNTINDLARYCGLETTHDLDPSDVRYNKSIISEIKEIVNRYIGEDGSIEVDELMNGDDKNRVDEINGLYDNIITHFIRLFGKVKFVGTHSAGVVITSGDILQYTALRLDKAGNLYASYNLKDLEDINVVKFDLLGLKTMQSLGECRRLTKTEGFDTKAAEDEILLEKFRDGETTGIFQLERQTARNILGEIECDSFDDVVATVAMNRPGPLGQKVPEQYAANKKGESDLGVMSFAKEYTKESYGTIVYQEQLLLICVEIGRLEWSEADKVLNANKHGTRERSVAILDEYTRESGTDLAKKFISGCRESGLSKEQAENLWDSLLVYSFNKGHATGYSLIALEEMYYKYYHPPIFWYSKIKYARDDRESDEFCNSAVHDGLVVFLTHVNYSEEQTSLRRLEGELVIQHGLTNIKGVGIKAAEHIAEERRRGGVFTSYDDFVDRCRSRAVTIRTIEVLDEAGALDFNKDRYIQKVTMYNSALYSRARA